MRIKARIRLGNQLLVEPPLLDPGFVTGDQQNRSAPWIESKGHPPPATCCIKAQLLHVGMPSK
jgi:hypothetical protein